MQYSRCCLSSILKSYHSFPEKKMTFDKGPFLNFTFNVK